MRATEREMTTKLAKASSCCLDAMDGSSSFPRESVRASAFTRCQVLEDLRGGGGGGGLRR